MNWRERPGQQIDRERDALEAACNSRMRDDRQLPLLLGNLPLRTSMKRSLALPWMTAAALLLASCVFTETYREKPPDDQFKPTELQAFAEAKHQLHGSDTTAFAREFLLKGFRCFASADPRRAFGRFLACERSYCVKENLKAEWMDELVALQFRPGTKDVEVYTGIVRYNFGACSKYARFEEENEESRMKESNTIEIGL